MKVSIIIPTRNEEKDLKDCLNSIKKQDYKNYEIIVVDGNSSDKTREIARKLGAKVILEKPAISPANARNLGAKNARGDIFLFVDADNVLPTNHLSKLVNAFKKGVDAVSTFTKPYKPNFLAKLFFQERAASYPLINQSKKMPPNAWKKQAFKKAGYYDPNIGFGEDRELNYKAKKKRIKKVFKKDIIIFHKEPSTWKRLYKEGKWFGRTLPFFAKKMPIQGLLVITAVIIRALILPALLISLILKLKYFSLTLLFFYALYYFFYAIKSLFYCLSPLALLMPLFKNIRNFFVLIGLINGIKKIIMKKSQDRGEN